MNKKTCNNCIFCRYETIDGYARCKFHDYTCIKLDNFACKDLVEPDVVQQEKESKLEFYNYCF